MTGPTATPLECRAEAIFRNDLAQTHRSTDRLMVGLLLVQWVGAVITSLVVSPLAWAGEQSVPHVHVWAAAVLGGILALFPAWLARRAPGAAVTRHVIAAAQMVFSALLIHLGGGRIEWHFHVFGSLAFVAVYRDWRVLLTATAIVAIDHFVRGVWWPRSVFGVLAASNWRWLEHAAWVLFEDSVLVVSLLRGLKEGRESALAQARLEDAMWEVEERVRQRTRELEEAMVRAESANRAKSEFLANMSHEIRTPMTAIVGFAEVLDDPSLTPAARAEHLATIRHSGRHLIGIINDILDLSKIEAGLLDVQRSPCDVAAVLAEVVAEKRGLAATKGLAIAVRCPSPLAERWRTNAHRLRQILSNLIGNAVKFTDRGQIRVTLEPVTRGLDAQGLRFEVEDTGIGIAPADLCKLFRPFSQVDTSGTRQYGGTGLGLAISARLAELLGGRIDVISRVGEGSRFTLTVDAERVEGARVRSAAELAAMLATDQAAPASSAPTAASSGPADRPARTSQAALTETPPQTPGTSGAPQRDSSSTPTPGARCSSTAHPCAGVHVLLAEDGADNQRLIAFHLRKAGAEVDVVADGQAAVDRLLGAARSETATDDQSAADADALAINPGSAGTDYHLVLMDMQMPVLDGYGAVRTLRSRGYAGPIVALTAHAMSGDREKCLAAGCDGYETKPISGPRLVETVLRWGRQSGRAAA